MWTHNGIARLDTKGNPHITSYEGEHEGKTHGGAKSIIHYYWSDTEWVRSKSKGLPIGASGEMQIISSNEINMLLSYKEDNVGEVALWKSTDRGESFIKNKIFNSEKGSNFDLSNFIINAKPEAKIIVAAKNNKANGKVYLVGKDGSVRR